MEIILLSIYLVTWLFINIIILKCGTVANIPPLTPIGNLSPADAREIAPSIRLRAMFLGLMSANTARQMIRILWRVIPANKYNILFQILILTAFLLLIFVGPHIQALNEAEKKTRKEFEEMADDTAKESEKVADKVFKQPWLDAMSKRNRYYIASFTTVAFIPFFYMCWSFFSATPPLARDGITSQSVYNQIATFDVFILEFTAAFMGIVVQLFTAFSKKSWYFYIVPAIYLFSFIKADTVAPVYIRNYSVALLLAIWPFFYFSKTSFLWSLPFILFIPAILLLF